jgi:hypothetical protein
MGIFCLSLLKQVTGVESNQLIDNSISNKYAQITQSKHKAQSKKGTKYVTNTKKSRS